MEREGRGCERVRSLAVRCLGLTCDTGLGTCVWHLLLLSWLTLSGASLSDADVSIGSNQCFVQGCSNFTVLDGPLTVTVGGFVRAITEFSVATGNCMASGEFWMYFPVCTAYRNPVGTVIVARPDLTVYMPNAVAPLRLTALLTDPNCRVRPGFAYQRWSYQGNFDQDLYFKSYPLDRHFLRVEFADSSYTEQLVRYVPDNVALSEENVVQVSGWDFIPSSTWGDIVTLFTPGSSNSSAQTPFSMGRIQVVVSRGGLVYAFRILPPIVVLILTSLLTGVMSLKDLAFRLTITVTGMLSIVFMQYSFSWGAPINLSYATRLDWIFFSCYIIQICCVGEGFAIYAVLHQFNRQNELRLKNKRKAAKLAHKGLDEQWSQTLQVGKWTKAEIKRRTILLRKVDVACMAFLTFSAVTVFLVFSLIHLPYTP